MSSLYGPIIFVEDDAEDHAFMLDAYKSLNLKNGWHLFTRAQDAYDYLLVTPEKPFIIISEVKLRGMDGIDLRRAILKHDYLRQKSIPFVFFTTNNDRKDVAEAYDLQVQGYFQKKYSIPEIARMLQKIIDYWIECSHPNNLP
jgi:CheY-like chemotaxis protein